MRISTLLISGTLFSLALPQTLLAYEPVESTATTSTATAEVLSVESEGQETIPGTSTITREQILRAEIVDGAEKGKIVTVKNDFTEVKVGDRFLLVKSEYASGESVYYLQDVDRRGGLLLLTILGIIVVVAFSGMVGVRALISLVGSVAAIIFVLLPLLLQGLPPVLMSVLISSIILAFVMYLTHGWNRVTHAALLGTVVTIGITGLISTLAVSALRLSGYSADESVYLNISTGGVLDLQGLLLAGIIVGVLGVLNDVAITQSATVAELRHAKGTLGITEGYLRAMRIGREHVGGLVNTLALAYVGASLPLLLLITRLGTPLATLINQELFAAEIVRTIVGTLALTLAVPITTLLALYLRVEAKGGGHTHSH